MYSMKNIITKLNSYYLPAPVIYRNYSKIADLNRMIQQDNVKELNNYSKEVIINKIENETAHTLDQASQKNIKLVSMDEYTETFSIQSFFKQYPKFNVKVCGSQFNTKQIMNQRANTITEIIVAEVSKNSFGLKKVELCFGKTLDFKSQYLTGQKNPDYLCATVLENGKTFEYHADLKIRNYDSFMNDINKMHPQSIMYTNFLYKKNLKSDHVFKGKAKLELEKTYYGVLEYYYEFDQKLAIQLYVSSRVQFKKFKTTGRLEDYNKIKINTPKFMLLEYILKYFKKK